jgi:glycosyltransferase involved in cell wall biosynthesis
LDKRISLIVVKTVSVIIPTFDRPDALAVAIWSALLQSHPALEIIVVGDSANAETQNAVESFSQSRIKFVNLPFRCGDQSIPNAIGTELATGEFVAYLNHDDVWGPKHLEQGLASMDRTGSKWFVGKSFFAHDSVEDIKGRRPIFSEISDSDRSCAEAFGKTYAYLEPNSSWIIEREAVLDVGNWLPANRSRRTPVASLGLKLARRFGEPSWGQNPTVAKIKGSINRRDGQAYGSISLEHEYLLYEILHKANSWFEDFQLEAGRRNDRMRAVSEDFQGVVGLRRKLLSICSKKWSARLFEKTGIDLVEFALGFAGVPRGQVLSKALIHRTGETHQKDLTVKSVLKELRKKL